LDDGLAAFVRDRYPRLLRRAYLLTGDAASAEDLVQEALARCCTAWRRGVIAQPEAYVSRAMINVFASHMRQRRLMRRVVLLEPAGSVGDGTAERAERHALWHALLTVPPRQRAVLVLRYYEDMDEQGIAAALNVTVGTVRSQLAKGLQHLRKLHEPSEQMGSRRDA